ncbi:MAG: hypothetical protein FWG36_09135 [Oscillospiraceae bacterium]|nr:hypothetical protein [Oscillospiraceae bacterium]
MAYETKVVLMSLGKLIKAQAKESSDKESFKKLYEDLADIANAEGVILKAFDDDR